MEQNNARTPKVNQSKRRGLRIAVIFFALLLIVSASISYATLKVLNPFSSGYAVVKILFTDVPFVEMQKNPKVIMAQPENANNLFLETMAQEGYIHLEEEQMGSLYVFRKDEHIEKVFFKTNDYYSLWSWLDE